MRNLNLSEGLDKGGAIFGFEVVGVVVLLRGVFCAQTGKGLVFCVGVEHQPPPGGFFV